MSNVIIFQYPKDLGGGKHPRLRISSDAIQPLFFCLAHTIEFNMSIRSTTPATVVTLKIIDSEKLGVSYPTCEDHNMSLLRALESGVTAASQIEMSPLIHQVHISTKQPVKAANISFRITIYSVTETREPVLFGFGTRTKVVKTHVAEFCFLIVKTDAQVSMLSVNDTAATSYQSLIPVAAVASKSSSVFTPADSAANSSQAFPIASKTIHSNDAAEIRKALQFIEDKIHTSITDEWFKYLESTTLEFEVEVMPSK
jgi:hypothetical protein